LFVTQIIKMNSNKKLCRCDDCSSKSNGEGKYVCIKTWNRHKKKTDLFKELEDNAPFQYFINL